MYSPYIEVCVLIITTKTILCAISYDFFACKITIQVQKNYKECIAGEFVLQSRKFAEHSLQNHFFLRSISWKNFLNDFGKSLLN